MNSYLIIENYLKNDKKIIFNMEELNSLNIKINNLSNKKINLDYFNEQRKYLVEKMNCSNFIKKNNPRLKNDHNKNIYDFHGCITINLYDILDAIFDYQYDIMDKNFNLNFGNGYILKPKIIRYLEGFEVKFKFINKGFIEVINYD